MTKPRSYVVPDHIVRANQSLALATYRNVLDAMRAARPAMASTMPEPGTWLAKLQNTADDFDEALKSAGIFHEWETAGMPQFTDFTRWLTELGATPAP